MSNTCAANPSATKQIPSKQQSTCPSASPSCLCVLEFLVFLFLVFLVFLVMVDFLVFHVFLLVLFLRTSWLYPTFRSIRARQGMQRAAAGDCKQRSATGSRQQASNTKQLATMQRTTNKQYQSTGNKQQLTCNPATAGDNPEQPANKNGQTTRSVQHAPGNMHQSINKGL